jgi:nucleotide-binding universal stress UspA family protein
MPFLSKANRIATLLLKEGLQQPAEDEPRIATSLRWHGFQVSVRPLRRGPEGAPQTLLGAASEEAQLLVMGGYGHSRLRERIFGGFTRHVLSGAPLPMLMMH